MGKKITFFHFGRYQKFKLYVSAPEYEFINGRSRIAKPAQVVVFKNGLFKTSDEETIAAVKKHRLFECADQRNKIVVLDSEAAVDATGAEDTGNTESDNKNSESSEESETKSVEAIAAAYLKDDLIAIAEKNGVSVTRNMKEATIVQKLIDANVEL